MKIFDKIIQFIFKKHYTRKLQKSIVKKQNNIYCRPRDILLGSKYEAQEVLYKLDYLIQLYGVVTLTDYYDIVGVTSDWTDSHYGWKSIDSAYIKPIKNGFLVCLPKAFRIR